MRWYEYRMCREKVEELIYDSYTTCPQRPKDLEIWISYYSSLFEIYFLWIHICFFCWCSIDGSWGLRPYAQLSIGFYFVGCLESSSVLFPCQLKISKCFQMVQVWGLHCSHLSVGGIFQERSVEGKQKPLSSSATWVSAKYRCFNFLRLEGLHMCSWYTVCPLRSTVSQLFPSQTR